MTNKHIPTGFHTATPYLMVPDGAGAVEFCKRAFGAREIHCMADPGGRIRHAELRIDDSPIMLGEYADVEPRQPPKFPRLSIYLYVADADAVFASAIAAGAKQIHPMGDKFYGNREGGVEDPFGIVWWIATMMEELSPEEVEKRAAAMMAKA